ncbi:ATP-binding protein [Isoptericola sp. NEAU-Y5]|uniref:ATP-binding protein n=1 Tax=Isoptericola luteus TaxID=2879484 RepID=A0ABS7ZDF5_9MICO|nr:AAA family ATPase [Isoptericola sp. NEAU-Y5]MCA5892492.1 ATP-binding protein [Isoptericola sp. NEAU-Y5]
MARQVVLVNGLPGSGKTTIARPLAALLGAPLLSEDVVREALADVVDHGAHAALGAAATEAVWRLAAAPMALAVVESWWFRPRDLDGVLRGLAVAGADAVVEVWCDLPPDVARDRYEAVPDRHPVHAGGRDPAAEWARWSAQGEPLALGPVVRQSTRGPVDTALLARHVRAALPGHTGRRGRAGRAGGQHAAGTSDPHGSGPAVPRASYPSC